MKLKQIGSYFIMAVAGGVVALLLQNAVQNSPESNRPDNGQNNMIPAQLPADFEPDNLDFRKAANHTVHAVVHVKTTRERDKKDVVTPYEFFFGQNPDQKEPSPAVGFGSGVIVSKDGYIATNYHVIRGADKIEVTLNDQRSYQAEVMGKDPNTDIALLQIDESNLPYLDLGNSNDLILGDWVLAVGNPFGLTSSVTAGIISAKERNLGVLQESEMPVESFLQTDAAVNVGNSGGALVNLKGELIGIPTLIISPTQTNIGTAFAVPSNILKRVKNDIIEFGEVRRGVLGVSIREVNSDLAEEIGLEKIEGIYVVRVVDEGAADKAGFEKGDVIVEVDGNEVNNTAELQKQISAHHPGDKIEVKIKRNGQSRTLRAELMSMENQRELIRQEEESLLGATFKMAPEELKEKLSLTAGVQVIDVDEGTLRAVGVKEGYIIVAINNQIIRQPSDIVRLLKDYSGNVYMQGIYPDGTTMAYTFSL
ncbi:MAG: Do family serine endopeptidase [Bacteroidota bacterium]